MLRCKKAKKGWVAATIIGGAGVLATGTAAIVQANKLKKTGNSTDNKTAPKSTDTTDEKQ